MALRYPAHHTPRAFIVAILGPAAPTRVQSSNSASWASDVVVIAEAEAASEPRPVIGTPRPAWPCADLLHSSQALLHGSGAESPGGVTCNSGAPFREFPGGTATALSSGEAVATVA